MRATLEQRREKARIRWQERKLDPSFVEHRRANAKAYYDSIKSDPSYKAKQAANQNRRYHRRKSDPEYMKRRRAKALAWQKKRYQELKTDEAYMEKRRLLKRRDYHANRDRIVSLERKRYSTDKEYAERRKTYGRQYYQKHRDEILKRERARSIAKKCRRHGITLAQYESMLALQGWRCAICGGVEQNAKKSRFNVDHDHATGKVRGLLCSRCNPALGLFYDSVAMLKKAIQYLENHCG